MTTVKESIEDLADLAHSIRTKTHLAEGTIVKLIEMTLQKQATDRQLEIQESQLGIRRNGNVVSIVPNEVITADEEQPPEEDA